MHGKLAASTLDGRTIDSWAESIKNVKKWKNEKIVLKVA